MMNKELTMASVNIALAITVGALLSPSAQASTIIGGSTLLNSASLTQLEGWLGEGQLDLTNIFTKQKGSASTDFHAAADGKGRTFSLMQVSGTKTLTDGTTINFSNVVGGYNPQSWNSKTVNSVGSYNLVPNPSQRTAFIFNITDNALFREDHGPDNHGDNGSYQTFNDPSYGPTFGNGYDLFSNHSLTFGFTRTIAYTNDMPPDKFGLLFGSDIPLGFIIGDLEVFTISPSEEVSSVPLPAALPLMSSALGLFGLGAMRRRNKS